MKDENPNSKVADMITKKKILLAALLLAGALRPAAAQGSRQASPRPNIIFILTDDQRYDALGAMGNSIIITPHLDSLAHQGMLFQNAYVTTSICCTSRASILTGQYASRHGINNFKKDFTPAQVDDIYPMLLKDHGYDIGFIGKFGVGSHPPDSIFDYLVDTEEGHSQPNYIIKGANGTRIHDTDTIGHAIQQFLDRYGHGSKPFCLSVSFKAPHEQDGHPPKYIIQPRYKDYYKNVTIPVPVTDQPKYWNQFPDFFRTEKNVARVRYEGLFATPGQYQENVKNYYRLITGVDDVVGSMNAKLRELGIDSNTVIIFMGDNGFFLGEHQLEGKWYGYEESIRVPMFIFDPHLPDRVRQTRPQEIALNIDVAPTILSLAGVPVPGTMQGLNLVDMAEGKIPARQDFFYQHYYAKSPRIPNEEGVVGREFKYMKYIEHGYEELFDITYDPHETDNLAKDPKYHSELLRMRKRYEVLKKAVQ